ncbi:hypothetical protein GDO86_004552 [Hymenochirus boettgeri]|uniref:FAM124 domain-containing protein n=1 Tax=Hymenochirus boettgeri TaxID=247094 RepID=A0A8T2K980_9PIPI|nr:hypothetical protein GDO86_004552 [Hymenochirus boettgeri]
MDRKAAEDEWEDSGAETGGSDYSRMSSTSSELSAVEVRDPFLVSIHVITDPGESRCLQDAIDKLLAWIHPDLQLFCVSERRIPKKKKQTQGFTSHPALAIILFLQEEFGEEQILHLHKSFHRPPWQFHHTEQVHGKFLPYMPFNQDFFTLANGTPLWAIRQVHYGKEIIRFTIYCSYENFADMTKMYELVLKKIAWKKKSDFCVFPVYSNMDFDIEMSLKRLQKGQKLAPLESALLEFRVKDFGQLIPLLPNQCSPISEGRWQTEDHDGNKILLQQVHRQARESVWKYQNYFRRNPATIQTLTTVPCHRKLKYRKHKAHGYNGQGPYYGGSQYGFIGFQGDTIKTTKCGHEAVQLFQRSKSLYCLPTMSTFPSCESFPLSEPHPFSDEELHSYHAPLRRGSSKINIDDLKGAQETDVDTGIRLSSSDLSELSAYSPLNGLCSDLEASLPSDNVLAQSDTFPDIKKSCEMTYDSFNSLYKGPSDSDTKGPKEILNRRHHSVDTNLPASEEGSTEEEEFYI